MDVNALQSKLENQPDRIKKSQSVAVSTPDIIYIESNTTAK